MAHRKFSTLALATIAIVLATTTLGHADPRQGGARGGFAGRPGGHFQSRPGLQSRPGFQGHGAFDARRFDHRFDPRFDGRRFDHRFDRRFDPRFETHRFDHRFRRFNRGPVIVAPFVAAPFVAVPFVWSSPAFEPPATNYWYYCPSYGAYWPSVQSCPVPWVTVPG